jgi:hypothetical protein
VLRQFVALAQQCLRKEDVMGRLGGEELPFSCPTPMGRALKRWLSACVPWWKASVCVQTTTPFRHGEHWGSPVHAR